MANLEGKKVLVFDLQGNDGKMHSVKDYQGETLVLYFQSKDNTPGCTKEAWEDIGGQASQSKQFRNIYSITGIRQTLLRFSGMLSAKVEG